jgi:hypothetical protein
MFHNFYSFNRRLAALASCSLLLVGTACQKDQLVSPSPKESINNQLDNRADHKFQEPVTTRNGKHLKFASRKDFEQTMRDMDKLAPGESMEAHLDKWEKAHNFYSLRAEKAKKAKYKAASGTQALSTQSQVSSTSMVAENEVPTEDTTIGPYETPVAEQEFIADDYLAAVLSPDQTIQIGETTYRLDGTTNHIYYISSDNAQLYDELIAEAPTSPDVYYYPMDQNVFELQDAGIEGAPATSNFTLPIGSGIGCGPNADRRKSEGGVKYSSNQRLDCKVVYQSVGIYFSIIAKAQNQKRVLGIWWSQQAGVYLLPNPGARWEELCRGYSESDFNGYSNFGGYGDGNTVAKRYYESTRGLKNYDVSVNFRVGQAQAGPFRIEYR